MNGRSVVQADSFQYTDSSPISFMGFLNSIHTGMVDSASIMFFVLIIGGRVEQGEKIIRGLFTLVFKSNASFFRSFLYDLLTKD